MRPYDVKSDDDLVAMESDNHPQDSRVWSILNQADKVSLHAPVGHQVAWFEIPRDQFNAIVDWYMKDQRP
jgi:hypothetical protein